MLVVSADFKQAITAPVKEVTGYLRLEDERIIPSDGELKQFTITATGKMLNTSMKKLVAFVEGQQDELSNTTIDVYYGVKLPSEEYEYVLQGKFLITKTEYLADTNQTKLEGYDNMLRFAKEYTSVSNFPVSLFQYLQAVCSGAGVILENESIYNGSLEIPEDYYIDIPDTTYRDVLREICEVTGTNGRILPNGNLLLEQSQDTGEILTYDNLLRYKLGEKYGAINSLVLSRQPQNDDVFLRNEEDINTPTTRNILDLNKFNVTYSGAE